MKKLKCLIILMIFILTLIVIPPDSKAALVGDTTKATLILTPATAAYHVNDNFTTSISVNTKGQSVVAVAAYLNYDNTSFEATSIDIAGTVFNTAQFESIIDQGAGKIMITLGKQSPGINSGNALVAKVNFKVINATNPSADNITFDFMTGSMIDSNVVKNDGLGTDILSGVQNAKYSVAAPDITPPVLTQVSAVPSLTKNNKPAYTFNSNKSGAIVYGGDCSAATAKAITGNNIVTFNALADGTHNNCTILVIDAAGNQSSPLAVNSFTVDTVAPILNQVTPVPTPINVNKPSYTFRSTEAGAIIYSGDCSSASFPSAVSGENTVIFNTLSNGTHSNCTIKVTDATGNQSLPLAVNIFTINTAAPIIAQVTPVPLLTNNAKPSYTFRSSGVGDITYVGDCAAPTVRAVSGNNTVVFNSLPDGLHNNCAIHVTDDLGNQSLPLAVNSFTIDTIVPTLTEVTPVPPLANNNKPSYTFNSTEAGAITYTGDCSSPTTKAVIGVNTVIFNTLNDGLHGNCTVKVTDAVGNPSAILAVSPFVTSTGLPSLSNVSVSRTINTATITWNTDRDSSSQANYGPTLSYGSSTPIDTNLVTAHSIELYGLTENTTYHFRVRSKDAAGNEKVSGDYIFKTHASSDLNLDGYVNTIDLGIMMSYWNSTDRPAADLNQDGIVNSIDAGILMSQWSI